MSWDKLQADAKKRLAARLKEHKVDAPPSPPSFDNIIVLRLPVVEEKTESGLIKSAVVGAGGWEAEPKSEGILCAAGLQALDTFRDHGILVGDHVEIGRFAGWEREAKLDAKGNNTARMILMLAADVKRSFDLGTRLAKGEMEIYWDEEAGEHHIRPIT